MSTRDMEDPTLGDTLALLNGIPNRLIERRSGVSISTLSNWRKGRTRSPQNKTIEFALRAAGYKRVIVRDT